jgi:hypothetical protein
MLNRQSVYSMSKYGTVPKIPATEFLHCNCTRTPIQPQTAGFRTILNLADASLDDSP